MTTPPAMIEPISDASVSVGSAVRGEPADEALVGARHPADLEHDLGQQQPERDRQSPRAAGSPGSTRPAKTVDRVAVPRALARSAARARPRSGSSTGMSRDLRRACRRRAGRRPPRAQPRCDSSATLERCRRSRRRVYPAANRGKPSRDIDAVPPPPHPLGARRRTRRRPASRFPAANVASPPVDRSGRERGRGVRRASSPATAFVAARLNPAVATGTGALDRARDRRRRRLRARRARLSRRGRTQQLRSIDNGAAEWGHDHATAFSTHGLNAVTNLGGWPIVGALAVGLVVVESFRAPSRWIVPFLVVLMAGNETLMLTIKDLADRARPTLNPLAATLGPSFPSGHSATAAAFYAGAALLLARRRSRVWRSAPRGRRRSDRDRRRGQPGSARRPLAFRCDCRNSARMGLVRRLQHRVRRTPAPLWCTRGDRRRNRQERGGHPRGRPEAHHVGARRLITRRRRALQNGFAR